LDTTPLERSLVQLQENLALLDSGIADGNPALRRALERGAIRAFAFTHTVAVGLLQRQMRKIAPAPAELNRMEWKDVLRAAADTGLIPDVEQFFDYREKRNLTSYTYREDIALELLAVLGPFVQDMCFLLNELQARNR